MAEKTAEMRLFDQLREDGISEMVASFAIVTACTMRLEAPRIPGYALALQALVDHHANCAEQAPASERVKGPCAACGAPSKGTDPKAHKRVCRGCGLALEGLGETIEWDADPVEDLEVGD